MKIGDKVRFLSETGGGRVSGFKGNNIVLVQDEDGFEIPTPINEVVVVTNEDYSSTHQVSVSSKSTDTNTHQSIKQQLSASAPDDLAEEEDEEEDDPSVHFVPKPKERTGGDKLSVCLAFVPVDERDFQNTTFETYLVNDSNYLVAYAYFTIEGTNCRLRFAGEVEPNTKLFLEEIHRNDLNSMLHLGVQLIAYKEDKSFLRQPMVDVQFRLDAIKFYKSNTFVANEFFEQHALLYRLVDNGKVMRQFTLSARDFKSELYADSAPSQPATQVKPEQPLKPKAVDKPKPAPIKRTKQILKDEKIVVDLHATEILDTTAGMSSADILEYQLEVFRRTLEEYKKNKGQKLIFIHGKGEGVLRRAIVHELNYRYKQYPYQDASFREYGYGATQVTIK